MTLLAAILSLTVPLLLGLLLLGCTCPAPPFRHAAGNLALAHMVGCGALTLLLLITHIVTGRLMVLPVYLFLVLLVLSWKRCANRIKQLATTQKPEADEAEGKT